MPIVGKFFPSQKSQEKVFLLLRRHWFTYFGFVFVALIMSVPLIILIAFWISNPEYFTTWLGNVAIIGIFVYILFSMGVMLYGFIDYYLDVYIITNERIVNIEQNGFFKREISELHLHQIQDVSAKVNGFLPTMIHYGDVFIQTAGERENFIFKSIPNPYRVSKLIVDLHEAQLEETPHEDIVSDQELATIEGGESGKTRDTLDLEGVSPKALSLARKRTKEFLRGGSLEETDLKNAVETSISDHKDEVLLNGVNQHNSNKKPEIIEGISGKAKTSQSPSIKNHNEGELHENEQIDIK